MFFCPFRSCCCCSHPPQQPTPPSKFASSPGLPSLLEPCSNPRRPFSPLPDSDSQIQRCYSNDKPSRHLALSLRVSSIRQKSMDPWQLASCLTRDTQVFLLRYRDRQTVHIYKRNKTRPTFSESAVQLWRWDMFKSNSN